MHFHFEHQNQTKILYLQQKFQVQQEQKIALECYNSVWNSLNLFWLYLYCGIDKKGSEMFHFKWIIP